MIQSLNPATGKLLRSFESLAPELLEAKMAMAASAAAAGEEHGRAAAQSRQVAAE